MKYMLFVIIVSIGQTLPFGPYTEETCLAARDVIQEQIPARNIVFCVPHPPQDIDEAKDKDRETRASNEL